MFILWIRKGNVNRQNIDEKQTARFSQEREDVIRQFRLEHPDITVSNARDIMTEDGNLLAAIHEVRLWSNIQN
jgi:hypothetical protein